MTLIDIYFWSKCWHFHFRSSHFPAGVLLLLFWDQNRNSIAANFSWMALRNEFAEIYFDFRPEIYNGYEILLILLVRPYHQFTLSVSSTLQKHKRTSCATLQRIADFSVRIHHLFIEYLSIEKFV